MGAIREVRKRDGRVVPFDQVKIADAIYKAVRSVGKGDRSLAEELAAAVTHFLDQRFEVSIPGIEDIQDQVETVLMETGNAEIAKAYILYRNKRAAVREALQVLKAPPEAGLESPGGGPEIVQDRAGVSSWSKAKITAALIREADMDIGVAEEIAAAVERKVFASGIRRISTALIRELVDNELFERGFSGKLFRQAPIGLPKYNLEQIIFGTDSKEGYMFPKTPVEVRDFIAREILQQYTLEEILSGPVSDAHRDGRIHVHRLGDPVRFARLGWDLALAARPESLWPWSRCDPAEIFQELARFARFVAGEIRLCGPGCLLGLQGPRSDSLPEIEMVQGRLREIQAGLPAVTFILEMDMDREALPWLQALGGRGQAKGLAIRLRLTGEGFSEPALQKAVRTAAALFGRGEPIEFLPARNPWAWPSSGLGLLPVAPKITVNLAQAAIRSAGNRLGSVERELEEILDTVIKGHLERRRFLERLGANPENPLWDLLGWRRPPLDRPLVAVQEVEFPIGIMGLAECVKFLTGFDFHHDAKVQRLGRSLVEAMARKLRRESRGLGLRLVLTETRNRGSVRRLEEIDRRRFPLQSAEIDRGRMPAPEGPRYTDGVRMHRLAPVDPLRRIEHLGGFMDWILPSGVIEDSPDLRSGGEDVVLSLLEESMPHLVPRGGPVTIREKDTL